MWGEIAKWVGDTNIQAVLCGSIASGIISYISYYTQKSDAQKGGMAKQIRDIEHIAIKHWCNPATDASNRSRAIAIQSILSRLAKSIKNVKEAQTEMADFRKAITSGDFSETTRNHVEFDSATIRLIQTTSTNLSKKLNLDGY